MKKLTKKIIRLMCLAICWIISGFFLSEFKNTNDTLDIALMFAYFLGGIGFSTYFLDESYDLVGEKKK